jgi:hypothetical protein
VRRLLLIGLVCITACGKPAAPPKTLPPPQPDAAEKIVQEKTAAMVHEPGRDDPERKALLDAVRAAVGKEMGLKVEFKVETLNVAGDTAFAILEPVHPGTGTPVKLEETGFCLDEGEFDGLRTEAILKKDASGWRVQSHAIGATDVWYEDQCATTPKGLIPLCANLQKKP